MYMISRQFTTVGGSIASSAPSHGGWGVSQPKPASIHTFLSILYEASPLPSDTTCKSSTRRILGEEDQTA
eukprot:1135358-Pyramimonas_sp.AAC.1